MKKSLILATLALAPISTFAGGSGNLDWYDSLEKATSAVEFSSENPNNVNVEANASFWQNRRGDNNGLIEAEEYLGEVRREGFGAGDSLDREDERQTRAQKKASRLRFLYRQDFRKLLKKEGSALFFLCLFLGSLLNF